MMIQGRKKKYEIKKSTLILFAIVILFILSIGIIIYIKNTKLISNFNYDEYYGIEQLNILEIEILGNKQDKVINNSNLKKEIKDNILNILNSSKTIEILDWTQWEKTNLYNKLSDNEDKELQIRISGDNNQNNVSDIGEYFIISFNNLDKEYYTDYAITKINGSSVKDQKVIIKKISKEQYDYILSLL